MLMEYQVERLKAAGAAAKQADYSNVSMDALDAQINRIKSETPWFFHTEESLENRRFYDKPTSPYLANAPCVRQWSDSPYQVAKAKAKTSGATNGI